MSGFSFDRVKSTEKKNVYENLELREAINHLFPTGRDGFFRCWNTGKLVKYSYRREVFFCGR